MMKPYTISAMFMACALSLSPAVSLAQMETDQTPNGAERILPAPALTEDELDWIENKCKLQHPISDENQQKCVTENKQEKLEEKARQDQPSTDEPMPPLKEMPQEE
jgi:hypothetical protein